MRKLIKVILGCILVAGVALAGMSLIAVRMMGGKSARNIPVPEARASLDAYLHYFFDITLSPSDKIEHAYQMPGRDGSVLILLRSDPARIADYKDRIRHGTWPPRGSSEPFSIKTLDGSRRGPETFAGYPAWWDVLQQPDREDLAVTFSSPDRNATRVHGVMFVFSPAQNTIYISRWST